MTTRQRSSSQRLSFVALCVALAAMAWPGRVSAQAAATEEAALRQRYGVARWPAGDLHLGVWVDRLKVGALPLRVRTDRLPADGGITLGFGDPGTTLVVRIAVGTTGADGRESLVGFLRGTQKDLVPLADPQGASVALGDSSSGEESVAALYGNVAISIRRTREGGPETPAASRVLALVRSVLGPIGAPSAPVLTLSGTRSHVQVAGASWQHVEATVRGGHLLRMPSPSGVDVSPEGPGAIEAHVVATDSLGRTAVATLALPGSSPAGP
jgi:hypothetical protein